MPFSPDFVPAATPAPAGSIAPLLDWHAPTEYVAPPLPMADGDVEGPSQKWSMGEIKLMIDLAQNNSYTNAQIANMLPGRSTAAVKHKLRCILDRGHHKWSAAENAQLRCLARSRRTLEDIAAILERTPEACRYKMRALGIEKQKNVPTWSDADLDYLRANYNQRTMKELQEKLRRSRVSIAVKASRLGLTHQRGDADRNDGRHQSDDCVAWTAEAIDQFRSLALSGFTLSGLRSIFNRNTCEIVAAAERHGISIAHKHWNDALTVRLRELAGQQRTRREIAAAMGFRPDFISAKARSFNIKIVRDCSHVNAGAFKFAPGESSVEQLLERLQQRPPRRAAVTFERPVQAPPPPPAKPAQSAPVLSREAELAEINSFLAKNSATKTDPGRSLVDEAILTLRRHGDVVFADKPGCADTSYKLNYSSTLNGSQLIQRANMLRLRRGETPLVVKTAPARTINAQVLRREQPALAACA